MTPLSTLGHALRLWHTLRYLKPAQVYRRIWRNAYTPSPDLRHAPGIRPFNFRDWKRPATRLPSMLEGERFCFLGQTHALQDIGWDSPAIDKLWRYNLHYFDDLNAQNAECRASWHRKLVDDWIVQNLPGKGTGWEPYPTSLRIVNWIKWALAGNELPQVAVHSLAVQTRWLAKRLEWHLLGNHLLANAKALVFAGIIFEGAEAKGWLRTGLSIYECEIPEQVLEDGGHFERSPMYHAIILEDLLDLYNLSKAYGVAGITEFQFLPPTIAYMRNWLAIMTHRDGGPCFFNDCAFGIAPSRENLEDYAAQIGLSPCTVPGDGFSHLAASGYVRTNCEDMSAILDVASIGPDYLPGHAHADTLSFELSIGTERVIVNGGTSTYALSSQRLLERSTAAHSTVEVNGESSSEIWGGFRVARRARVYNKEVEESNGTVFVSAEHNGYCRFGQEAIHKRQWVVKAGQLTIRDWITGDYTSAVSRLHLGPGVVASVSTGGLDGEIITSQNRKLIWTSSMRVRVESSQWHPGFGKTVATQVLVAEVPLTGLKTSFSW